MGWERGQARGAVVPAAGAPPAVGEPRGVLCFPAAKGPEQEVSPLRTWGGNEFRPKPTATGHTTPAVSALTAKMEELGGVQQHPPFPPPCQSWLGTGAALAAGPTQARGAPFRPCSSKLRARS